LEIYSPQNSGTGKHSPAPRKKFKIPEKGRIRFVLAVALAVALAKFAGPCVFNQEQKDIHGEDGRLSASDKIHRDDNNKIGGKDTGGKSKDAGGRQKRPLFKRERKSILEITADTDGRARDGKSAEQTMGFGDVRRLIKDYGIGLDAPEQSAVIKDDGKGRGKGKGADTLAVSLSVDTALQKYAASMFKRYRPRYAAAAAIDPSTGRVLALASYSDNGLNPDSGAGGNLCLSSVFPAASVFKTVVAAAGIERAGMTAKTTIPHFGRNHTLYRTQLQKDLKVSRDITLQDAFAYSVNPAFARIALFNTNKDAVAEYGRRLGFRETVPFELDVETSAMLSPDSGFSVAEFASGFNRETTLSPLLGALIAGAICGNGVIYEPSVVDSVRSSKSGAVIYSRNPKIWRRAVKESTANELRLLMTKVTRYGTARKAFRPLRESNRFGKYEFGGKTGNVNKLGLGRVDWFIGFARDPNDKTKRIAVGVVTTHGEYWTVQSSYIASELFKKYIAGEEQKKSGIE
jgi:cell division protein FtsI/penicillin-binding protein 2